MKLAFKKGNGYLNNNNDNNNNGVGCERKEKLVKDVRLKKPFLKS